MTVVLALDLGTLCGWALGVVEGGDRALSYGQWNLKDDRFSGGGMRFVRFRAYLDKMLEGCPIDRVYFEEVRRHRGVDAAHAYGGYLAVLTEWCESNAVPYDSVPVGTWKRWLTGKGNASKQDVIDILKIMGHDPKTEDEADALGVLLFKISGRA
ncbi:crossover junction endodeoxyribonuclease RuvC [Rhodoligotrophos defluvii]|uniref:crossover junction endodeoxyribonuclease RuvC n=1 Tax=Rhodoligotrophos defluvii TaxID=2561934 RepID=UPI0010C96680|nr:crossover junction endodeoxyribonuclease RuvC [Rhodoligotrophos defluvii]